MKKKQILVLSHKSSMHRAVLVQMYIELTYVYELMIERTAFGVDGKDHPLLKETTLFLSVHYNTQCVIGHVIDKGRGCDLLGGDWGIFQ